MSLPFFEPTLYTGKAVFFFHNAINAASIFLAHTFSYLRLNEKLHPIKVLNQCHISLSWLSFVYAPGVYSWHIRLRIVGNFSSKTWVLDCGYGYWKNCENRWMSMVCYVRGSIILKFYLQTTHVQKVFVFSF